MKTKLKVLLSASLITAVATTAAIFATAIKSKLRKQHDLKEKYNNLKLELENLIKLAKIGNIESLNEIKALNNSKIDNNSTVKEIENATKEIEKAVESINKKIINKKHDDQIQQEMANKAKQEFIAKKNQLKKLINSSQLSNIDKLNELKKLNDININDKDLDEEIKNKTKAIEKNIDSLTKKINEKKAIEQKAQQLQEFETTKKALEELLNSEDGQKVNSDDIKKILQNNNVNNSSTNTQIIQKGNEIKKAKQDLQKLIDDAKNKAKNGFDAKKQELKKLLDSATGEINKQTEDEEYKNIEVKGNASIKDIENKTKAIETAINSLTKKIQKSQCLQNFNNAKRILEEFIENDEDAKNDELISNLNDAKQELAKFNVINDSHEINEIKEATNSLTNAKAKLEQEIKNKKQELFNAFELSKTALQNYITNDIKDSKYKIIQDKFNNVIEEYKNITSNDKISKIKDATNNLNAKFIEIGSNKAILDKFYELKPKLEKLLNTANLKDDAKSENIDLSSEDQASADSKAINNSSTIENIEQVNQKLQTAIDKLAKDIQKINDDKKAKFEEFKTEKQHLENIIKTKGLDKFINIDDEIKSINQKINEKINEYSSINQDSIISEIDDSNKKIVASQEEFLKLLDDYLSKRNELIRNHNTEKQELQTLIDSAKAKNVDISEEMNIVNNANIGDDDSIDNIRNKINKIQDAINQINSKIRAKKEQAKIEYQKFLSIKERAESVIEEIKKIPDYKPEYNERKTATINELNQYLSSYKGLSENSNIEEISKGTLDISKCLTSWSDYNFSTETQKFVENNVDPFINEINELKKKLIDLAIYWDDNHKKQDFEEIRSNILNLKVFETQSKEFEDLKSKFEDEKTKTLKKIESCYKGAIGSLKKTLKFVSWHIENYFKIYPERKQGYEDLSKLIEEIKKGLNSLDMNDIKNLDWVNAKNSELNEKHRHYLKEYKLLQEEKK
ncbi:hypothetical protein KN71_003255 [Metamycoplasma hominis]|uniref:Uncharacterized protein n=1 Tax=Metamycoplasma hominis TaxID=2098 RepID=A0A454CAF6_METHO|nr:hypothetical protein [Metamycoplasma hominis]AYN65684.1 hypothetical protein KN71_003255 [Metamycoplasma hominis]